LVLDGSQFNYDPCKVRVKVNDIPEDEIVSTCFPTRREKPEEQLSNE